MADVIELPLTKGYTAIVDAADGHLAFHKWHAHCQGKYIYAARRLPRSEGGKVVFLHHCVIGRPESGRVTDHVDGNTLNNRRCNLRNVPHRINLRNIGKEVGVGRYRSGWRAYIEHEEKSIHLGYYASREEALNARLRAERVLWGIQPRREYLHAQSG